MFFVSTCLIWANPIDKVLDKGKRLQARYKNTIDNCYLEDISESKNASITVNKASRLQ
jgi:hypothetical protein